MAETDPEANVKSVGQALERLAHEIGLEERRPAVAVHEHWAAVAGEDVAAHAVPKRLREGVLTVEVDDPAWATHVHYLGPSLAAALNEAVGAPVVAEIRVVVGRPAV